MKASMRSILLTATFLAGSLPAAALAEDNPSVMLRVATSESATSARQICGLEPLRDAVKDVGIDLRLFPGGQLGSGDEQLEAMQNGTIDIIPQDGARLAQFVPEYDIMGAAFLFRDLSDVQAITHGPIGKELEAKLQEKTGIRTLGYWAAGARQVTSRKPIRNRNDLQGVKLRVNPTKMAETTVRGMGASAIALSIGELYTSLQNGTVDAQENPINTIAVNHFNEVQDYINLTSHSYFTLILTISDKAWNKLNDAQKERLASEALKTEESVAKCTADGDGQQLKAWEESGKGMTVIRDVDRASFEGPVYEAYLTAYGKDSPFVTLYDRVKASRPK